MPVSDEVLVVGGGVAGLRCAVALADIGLRVTVIEQAAQLGGRACTVIDDITGDAVDIGPHVVSTEHRHFMAWLQRLGTHGNIHWQQQPLVTLHDGPQVLRMRVPAWPVPFHGLPALPNALRAVKPADLLSATRLAWTAARLDEAGTLALDDEDALSFLQRMGVRARLIEWFFASAVMALLNVPLAQCSAAALMRVFRLMMGRSGYFFGFPRIGLADLFVPGSVEAITRAGGRVITGAEVMELLVEHGRFAGVVLHDGRRLYAPAGVLAVPPQAMAVLGRRGQGIALEAVAKQATVFTPSRYLSTTLWFDRPLAVEPFWARTVPPGGLNTDFYHLSRIREPGDAERASVIACNAIHPAAAWSWTDAQVVARTLEEVRAFVPDARDAQVVHARVHRVPMAIPCPAPGTERRRPPTRTEVPGVWMAGDWTATALPCSMESAARSGALAAEAVAAQLGRPLQLATPPPDTTGLVALLRRRTMPSAKT